MRKVLSIFKLILLLLWSIICIAIAFVAYLLTWSKSVIIFLAKHLWAGPALFLMGARIKVSGKENIEHGKAYLIMANHASYADIPTLFYAIPLYLRFIGKKELQKVPFLGWYMIIAGMIFIDRSNARKANQSLEKAAALANSGKNIVIFPEGTTIETGEIAPFKRGCYNLAQKAALDILPVRIKGTLELWSPSKVTKIRGGRVSVRIGEPIKNEDYRRMDAVQFLNECKDRIEKL